ncbi:MAG: prepilin peptidase, partial [Gammaproteobacteria bacterium]|nr:prepilin peptidase [Gammaproteobacteria bacterium]
PIPFGPYLAGAGWLAMLWGHEITTAYINSFG